MKKIITILSFLLVSIVSFSQTINQQSIVGELGKKVFAGSLPSGVTETLTGSTVATNNAISRRYTGGSGGATNFSEYISYNDIWNISSRFEKVLIFKPVATGSGVSLYIGRGGGGTVCYARFNYATGILTYGTGTTDAASTSALPFTFDSELLYIRLVCNRADANMWTATVGNFNGVSVSVSAGGADPVFAMTSVCFHGGTTDIFQIAEDNFIAKTADILGIGDSIMYGFPNSDAGAWFELARRRTPNILDKIGSIGARSADIVTYLPQIIKMTPKRVFLNIGTNDQYYGSVTLSAYLANIDLITNALTGIGCQVTLISILPNNGTNSATIPTWNTALAAKANGTTITYVDIYTGMDNGSGNLAPANTSDGVHLTAAGNIAVYNLLLPEFRKTIQI